MARGASQHGSGVVGLPSPGDASSTNANLVLANRAWVKSLARHVEGVGFQGGSGALLNISLATISHIPKEAELQSGQMHQTGRGVRVGATGATGTIGAISPPSTFSAPPSSTFGMMQSDQLLGRDELVGFSGRDSNATSGNPSLLNSGDTKMQQSEAIAEIDNVKRESNNVKILSSPYGASAMPMRIGYMDEMLLEYENQARSMPADLVYGRDRRPSFPFISGDGFRSMCKHRCEEKGCAFSPDDVKRGDCIYIATTNLENLGGTSRFLIDFSEIVDKVRNEFVVITHNGDLSSPDGDAWHRNEDSFYSEHHSHLLSKPKLLYWFASNCNWKDYPAVKPAKLVCIPIGIENRYNTIGKFPERYFPLMQQRSHAVPKKRLLVAFSAEAIKPSRGPALAALSASWITKSLMGREAWLKAVQEHFFVACPPGHGYDTHRLWEVHTHTHTLTHTLTLTHTHTHSHTLTLSLSPHSPTHPRSLPVAE